MPAAPVRIGTRGSDLALTQARQVRALLGAAHPTRAFEIEIVKTTGDQVRDVPLQQIGGQGAFTKELETALHDGRVDVAVHSLKDLPTRVDAGLRVGAVPVREDPRDAFISRAGVPLRDLAPGASVGTGSVRRGAQLLACHRGLSIRDIRGNVETRLRKVAEGEYDATVLAYAGLRRLGRTDAITEVFPFEVMLPAPAQGAIGVECRDEPEWLALLAPIHDADLAAAVQAERAFLDACGGGCHMPVGALATVEGGAALRLEACITAPDGSQAFRRCCTATPDQAENVGRNLAQVLLDAGARDIIDGVLQERTS